MNKISIFPRFFPDFRRTKAAAQIQVVSAPDGLPEGLPEGLPDRIPTVPVNFKPLIGYLAWYVVTMLALAAASAAFFRWKRKHYPSTRDYYIPERCDPRWLLKRKTVAVTVAILVFAARDLCRLKWCVNQRISIIYNILDYVYIYIAEHNGKRWLVYHDLNILAKRKTYE